MRPARAVQLALQLLEALIVLHDKGHGHGDVHPERIIILNGQVSLLPARVERPAYDVRDRDVHNAAAILYDLLTRTAPEGDTPASQRTPAVLPARLDEVIARALDASRAGHFPSAVQLAQELRVCLLDALGTTKKQRF